MGVGVGVGGLMGVGVGVGGLMGVGVGVGGLVPSPTLCPQVPPPKQAEKDMVCLIITQTDPSAPNFQLAKLACGGEPCKSFRQTKLSEMIERLWVQGLGVPLAALRRYAGQSGRERHLRKEAWFRGVADPTGGIPSGYVFVSGFTAESLPLVDGKRCVFVTRSPCVLPEHGRWAACRE